MSLVIDQSGADASSRLTAIRLTVLTARVMELWRRGGARDIDTAMILIAVAVITTERLTRMTLPEDLRALERSVPEDLIGTCNVSSIAAATGLNRETARRRVAKLVGDGVLVRNASGDLYFPPGYLQRGETRELVRQLLETVTRFANDCLKDGVLRGG